MRWPDDVLRSPTVGAPLRHERPHALTDGAQRWPVVDRVPLLLASERAWLDELLGLLDAGEDRRARALLLGDRTSGSVDGDVLADRMLAGGPSLRVTLDRLAADPDARHAHASLLPDHLAALALLGSRHASGPVAVLGAGGGLLVRDVARAGLEVVGVDHDPVLLWVARRFGSARARLVAADPEDAVRVLPDRTFGTAVVSARHVAALAQPGPHGPAVVGLAAEVARVATTWLAVGVQPDDVLAGAGFAGAPVTALADGLRAGGGVVVGPVRADGVVGSSEGWGVTAGPGGATLDLARPPDGASLRRNPLLLPLPGGDAGQWAAAWPTPHAPPGADWTLAVTDADDPAARASGAGPRRREPGGGRPRAPPRAGGPARAVVSRRAGRVRAAPDRAPGPVRLLTLTPREPGRSPGRTTDRWWHDPTHRPRTLAWTTTATTGTGGRAYAPSARSRRSPA